MRLGRAATITASLYFLRERRYRGMVISNSLIRCLWGIDQIQAHPLQALVPELQGLGSTVGKVDNPARNDGATVIDPYHDGLTIAQVGHPHVASHGKREVGSGHVVHVIGLAAGGGFPLKIPAIPRRGPNLIRFRFASLFADFGFYSERTNRRWCRLRDVRSLSRSQADDQCGDRQSMSKTSLHSVLLAYSKVS